MTIDQAKDTRAETKTARHQESTDSIELRPDGEDRFRAAVRAAAKNGPMHRSSKG